jgi:hypothetical protein
MRQLRTAQTSFTSGEIGPGLAGRIEVSRYYAGAELLRNVLVRPQGGIRRRPGMRHVATLPGGASGVRLIPFAFNTEQTYVLALRDGAVDVFRSDGASLATVTGCPWNGAQAAQMNRAQSADTLLLFHPDVAPQRIQRGVTETTWTRTAVPFTNIPAFNFGAGPEPVISATRGWPECGTFHDGRLWLGGLRSRPATFLASRVADFFNLNTGTALDDDAINATIDTDQVNAIHQMASGRGLLIFTSGAEHTIEGVPITPKTVERRGQTRRGIRRFTPVAEVDGATLFVQRGGAALRQFLYSDTEAAWRSDLASLLAPHLILDPIELAARTTARQDDADHVLLVNAGGTMTVMTTLRAQEVVAFTRWETQGSIRSAACLVSGEVFFAVERAGTMRLERWDDSALLDASAVRTSGTPFTLATGLGHLEGAAVPILATTGGATFLGRVPAVASGQTTLPQPVLSAEIGLGFDVRARTLPIEPRDASGALLGRRSRINAVTLRLNATGGLAVQGQEVPFRRIGAPPAPPMDVPLPLFTGDVALRGLVGIVERPQVEVSQPAPLPMELLALTTELRVGE